MAARELKRPVKLLLTRAQLFEQTGSRPRTEQHLRVGADKDGKLVAIDHASTIGASLTSWSIEPSGRISPMLYSCPNVRISHEAVWLNTPAPGPMRAPGETPGTFALESALDELAVKLGIDPMTARQKRRDARRGREAALLQPALGRVSAGRRSALRLERSSAQTARTPRTQRIHRLRRRKRNVSRTAFSCERTRAPR